MAEEPVQPAKTSDIAPIADVAHPPVNTDVNGMATAPAGADTDQETPEIPQVDPSPTPKPPKPQKAPLDTGVKKAIAIAVMITALLSALAVFAYLSSNK